MPQNSPRKSALDDIGNPDAKAGTPDWSKWMVTQARLNKDRLDHDVSLLKKILGNLEKYEAWKALGLVSFSMLCSVELGLTQEDVDAIRKSQKGQTVGSVLSTAEHAKTAKPMKEHGGDRKSEGKGNQGVDNTLIRGSTNAEYLSARIARDRPDVLDRMKDGEFKSVRAAAIEAGIVKKPTAVEVAQKAFLRLTKTEQRNFIKWAQAQTNEAS